MPLLGEAFYVYKGDVISNVMNDELEQRHEGVAFLLLICFCDTVLIDFPVKEKSTTVRIFKI
jgi:hypothetical protein